MGWGFGDFVDAVSDAASDVGSAISDAASDVGSGIADAAVAVGEAAVDVAGNAGGYLGDGVGFLGGLANTATFGGAGALLNAVDDTVFDGVDYVTGGVVDIDFDDGRFSASLGIDGVADVGASIGEEGLTASADAGFASTDVGLTDSGFSFDTSGGVDFGPLPYYNGHVNVSPTGDVSINGHVQGTVPTPIGLLSGSADGGFVRTDQGWGTYVDADGTLMLPSGTSIAGGLKAGYMESGDDSQTTFGVHGSVSEPGVGTVGGSFGYQSTTHDGITVTTESAEAHASGFGASVSAGEQYVGIDTPQGSFSQTTTNFDASGASIDALEHLSDSLLGDDAAPTGAPGAPGAAGVDPTTPTSDAEPSASPSFDDDLLGMASASAPAPDATPMMATDAGFDDGAAAPVDDVVAGDPSWNAAPDMTTDAPADVVAPVDDLTQAVGSADQIQQDTDDMFDDLT